MTDASTIIKVPRRGCHRPGRGRNLRRRLDMPQSRPLAERLWEKIERGAPDECWEWQACTNACGYGTILYQRSARLAHRMTWELTHGPIPAEMCVLHRCDNPPCCNPAHLFLGDHGINMRDMRTKGRGRTLRGSKHPNAVLTDAQIAEIRATYISLDTLAARYGISKSAIQAVVRGKTYRGVT